MGTPVAPEPTFTWEVHRDFYPEPRWPKHPGRTRRVQITALLLVSGVLLLAVSSLFTWTWVAGDLGGYVASVHGRVTDHGNPLAQVEVQLTGASSGSTGTVVTNGSGYFTFAGVGEGSLLLRFAANGYVTTSVTVFLSPYADYPPHNLTDLSVEMVPGNSTTFRAMNYSPFSGMEDFLASVLSTSVIEAIGGAVAIWGAAGLARTDRPPRGVVGGAGGFLAPFFPLALGTSALYGLFYPPSGILLVTAGGSGLLAALLALVSYRPFLRDEP